MNLNFNTPMLVGGFCICILSACAHYGEPPTSELTTPEFLLIYLIHGDGNYSYYSTDGTKHKADVDAVAQALKVANTTQKGEVIIFHQKAAPTFFQRKGGSVYYHYRFGVKIQQKGYSRFSFGQGLDTEGRIIEGIETHAPIRFFAYFGHEISEKLGKGYSASYPTQNFTLAEFASLLRSFTWPDSSLEKPFSLVVLSTCHGANRATTLALAPFTDYLIGSPTSLHLSYFNTLAFGFPSYPDQGKLERKHIPELAARISYDSFKKLQEFTQTEIAIATYAMNSTSHRIAKADEAFQGFVRKCVDLHYRPARFGMNLAAKAPLEWECP